MTLASATVDAQSLFSSDRRQITWKAPAIFFPVGRINGLNFRNSGQETAKPSATAEVNSANGPTVQHFNKIFEFLQSSTACCWVEETLPLSLQSFKAHAGPCCNMSSDTILSHPHASDRRGGCDYKLQSLRLRAP